MDVVAAELHHRQDRLPVELGVVQAVEQVQAAGAGGRQADAELAGELGVAARHEGGRLLVPRLDEADLVPALAQGLHEAVDAVDKFLDEAYLNSLSEVRIVHGHGTGALRRVISELLKGHPHVARFSAAPANQGGAGATKVELHQ